MNNPHARLKAPNPIRVSVPGSGAPMNVSVILLMVAVRAAPVAIVDTSAVSVTVNIMGLLKPTETLFWVTVSLKPVAVI
jgi:hypothetical protein